MPSLDLSYIHVVGGSTILLGFSQCSTCVYVQEHYGPFAGLVVMWIDFIRNP